VETLSAVHFAKQWRRPNKVEEGEGEGKGEE